MRLSPQMDLLLPVLLCPAGEPGSCSCRAARCCAPDMCVGLAQSLSGMPCMLLAQPPAACGVTALLHAGGPAGEQE